jgi:hypothetical protein
MKIIKKPVTAEKEKPQTFRQFCCLTMDIAEYSSIFSNFNPAHVSK